jgi:ribosomal protein S18 acetylase RimI-like enzyme
VSFTIRRAETSQDFEDYYAISFGLFKRFFYKGSPEPDEVLFEKHRSELQQIDFDDPDRCLYVAHDERYVFAGALWVGVREEGFVWDLPEEIPAWVYDVEVAPAFRGQGLGRQLMLQAEEWTRTKELKTIGLHTSHDLKIALHLYRSMGYTEKSIILRKTLTGDAALPAIPFTTRVPRADEDLSEYHRMRLDSFRELVTGGATLSGEEVRERYPSFKVAFDLTDPARRAYLAETPDGTFAGFILAVLQKKGEEKRVWLLDLQVKPQFRRRGLGTLLLQLIENWSYAQGGDSVQMFLNVHFQGAVKLFQSLGYETTNFYMEKELL